MLLLLLSTEGYFKYVFFFVPFHYVGVFFLKLKIIQEDSKVS